MTEFNILNLPNELILKIFECCQIKDLRNLSLTCIRFADLINNATFLGNTIPILVTNQVSTQMKMRCKGNFYNVWEKCRVSRNWKIGLYKQSIQLECKRCLPWLVLHKDYLWITRRDFIYAYKRQERDETSFDLRKPYITVKMPVRVDIYKFAYKGGRLVSGQSDGSLLMWKSEEVHKFYKNCHNADTNSVDLEGEMVVSGCKNGFLKAWNFNTNREQISPVFLHDFKDCIWSTALSSSAQYLAVGTAGYNVPPLHIADLQSGKIIQTYGSNFPNGFGVLHTKWENPNELVSCGYDASIRIWDKRIGDFCVASWDDPFNNTIYCVETDNNCTMISGTQLHGQVVLWDKRKKDTYVQVYFIEVCKKRKFKSPIYSLSFDATRLYTATARNLNILDFSITKGRPQNFAFPRQNFSHELGE